jgi:hypothetical protein
VSHKRIKLTHTPRWAKGKYKCGPGFYASVENGVNVIDISEAELREYFGLPDTPENSRLLREVAERLMREQIPGDITIEEVEDPE